MMPPIATYPSGSGSTTKTSKASGNIYVPTVVSGGTGSLKSRKPQKQELLTEFTAISGKIQKRFERKGVNEEVVEDAIEWARSA